MNWKTVPLGKVVALQRGYDLPEQHRNPGAFHIVGSAGPNGTHNTANVSGPGVVIGRSGSGFGRAHYCQTDFWALNTGLFVSDFRNNEPKFVFYLLDHLDFSTYNSGGAQPSLNRNFIYPISVHLPPRNEQVEISAVLSAWDSAIDKTERLISSKQNRNIEIANRLLFGVTRLGKHNKATTKALHWFTAPADWQAVEIGDVAQEKSVQNRKQIGLPVLSCTKYDGLVDSLLYFNKQIFSHDTAKYKVVERGQFAYATNHIEEGSIGYQDFLPAGLVSPMYTVFRPDSERIDGSYFYKLLKSEKMRQIFAARTNASVDRRGSLRWKDFARIPVALPSITEQQKISRLLDEAAHEVALLQREVAALKTQKRGLMQKLLTGQWRVPMSVNEASEVHA